MGIVFGARILVEKIEIAFGLKPLLVPLHLSVLATYIDEKGQCLVDAYEEVAGSHA